jgi:hypothetical protein
METPSESGGAIAGIDSGRPLVGLRKRPQESYDVTRPH